ncbi:efflux RND transporter periplasmic adaptor subunit [Pseudoxanthomonas winnipegensis]|jgi:cobalt-zinc-cadmium efflux system membrane fusion protein|uniref:Efflux RND transporter periplasmic adaptor subunit n=1 Tax=Pseudoxanthomonas winnipegensis TaxID=2480810 RepID=A0A4Q8LCV9_9GAMM|nr:efflux RND transporter periplasmic adaptor subunit [Pseudoxanthomonas winnipegensis]TAA26693.1 efflux RND transporter periplasmic adaptor subunit [Pseudoxanthomonas winnipegensis]TAA36609.1 efflux RND transporter periplasmic adaptor subunit [Pseudoxanthomonas winnipegensis]
MKIIAKSLSATALALTISLLLAGCGKQDAAPATEDKSTHADEEAEGSHEEEGGEHEEAAESTVIDKAEADANGIAVALAGPGTIAQELEVQGLLAAIDGSVAQVTARYPGRIQALRANVGDQVKAGQSLAAIESNLSLSTYSVATPLSGVVLSRQAQVGGGAAEGQPLFEIANLSKVWADLNLFGDQIRQVPAGAPVTLTRLYDGSAAQATIERVLPGTFAASQSAIARITLDNADGQWRPGMAVTARITTARRDAALVLPLAALQTMDGRDAVFVRSGNTYTARAVKTGARDATHVEVLEGVKAGEEVVVAQSYLVKADIEKSGASHEH